MNEVIHRNKDAIIEICRKHNIITLFLFGSATSEDFTPGKSDIDLMVEFDSMKPGEHARQFFGFIEDMEYLLKHPVDVIESAGIKNPYFLKSVQESKELIYARS
mgnify:CR=1 FL=1